VIPDRNEACTLVYGRDVMRVVNEFHSARERIPNEHWDRAMARFDEGDLEGCFAELDAMDTDRGSHSYRQSVLAMMERHPQALPVLREAYQARYGEAYDANFPRPDTGAAAFGLREPLGRGLPPPR
jgi:hypothetical protein